MAEEGLDLLFAACCFDLGQSWAWGGDAKRKHCPLSTVQGPHRPPLQVEGEPGKGDNPGTETQAPERCTCPAGWWSSSWCSGPVRRACRCPRCVRQAPSGSRCVLSEGARGFRGEFPPGFSLVICVLLMVSSFIPGEGGLPRGRRVDSGSA